MTTKKIILVSILAVTALWMWFSWPLPMHLASGIPATATEDDPNPVRKMIAGDHLQVLYNYWVFTDMLIGETPLFYNYYEFNVGDDAARRYVGADLMPFSLLFTLFYAVGGEAIAYNLLGWTAFWLSMLFTWLLIRDHIKNPWLSGLVACLAIALPYPWVTVLGGSTASFCMICTPLMMLGMRMAARRQSVLGAILAVLALLAAAKNDAHVFYFTMMLAPVWFSMMFAERMIENPYTKKEWRKMILALLVIAIPIGLYVLKIQLTVEAETAETNMATGRDMHEVLLSSPHPWGLYSWKAMRHEHSIYIGHILPVLFLAGAIFSLALALRKDPERLKRILQWGLLAVWMLGLTVIIMLALGVHGPKDGLLLRMMRNLVPHYDMIRQPAKIFVIFPPMVAYAMAWMLFTVRESIEKRPAMQWGLGALLVLALFEYNAQVRPGICLLDPEQSAYAAASEDAKAEGEIFRGFAIPIWPGDSAWSSLYQYYALRYHARMVNGYLPVINKTYVEEFVEPFKFANIGQLDDERLNGLLDRGIRYLFLHEDAFPEQVSTYAVAFTLHNLMAQPRLSLLKHADNIWAFKVHEAPVENRPAMLVWPLFAPTIHAHREMEHQPMSGDASVVQTDAASAHGYVELANETATINLDSFPHGNAKDSQFMIRCRGIGDLQITMTFDDGRSEAFSISPEENEWTWQIVPILHRDRGQFVETTLKATRGPVDVDMLIYAAGSIPSIEVGDSWSMPASSLFHAGYTDPEENEVVIRPDWQPRGDRRGVIYGPNLPMLNPGTYRVEIDIESDAPDGTVLGSFYLASEKGITGDYLAIAGQQVMGVLPKEFGTFPFGLFLDYTRKAEMRVGDITFTRLD